MKILKQIFIILCVLNISCSLQREGHLPKFIYNSLEVDDCQKDLRKGNVAIYFTSGFNNDVLFLYKNDSLLEKLKLTTSCTSDLAGYIEVGSIEQVKTIGLKIAKSDLKRIECNSANQIFLVSKSKDTVIIESVCYFPRFY